jgi:hypothetical protein
MDIARYLLVLVKLVIEDVDGAKLSIENMAECIEAAQWAV